MEGRPYTETTKAIHEAGHAVMAYYLGIKFNFVSIESGPGFYARCNMQMKELTSLTRKTDLLTWGETKLMEKYILCYLAGPAAQYLYDDMNKYTYADDLEKARMLISALPGYGSVEEPFEDYFEEAIRTLNRPSKGLAVALVAGELLRTSRIEGERVREIIKRSYRVKVSPQSAHSEKGNGYCVESVTLG